MNLNIAFSRCDLGSMRKEARRLGVEIPKDFTAMRVDRHWYRVEWRNENGKCCGKMIGAANAFDAKARFIEQLVHAA